MMNGENFYFVSQQSINNAIAVNQNLTDLILADFWDNTAYSWKIGQAVSCLENPLSEQFGISGRIASDEETN
jgi:hypothetical protein